MKRFVEIVVLLIINSAIIALVVGAGYAADRSDNGASDPLNATYLIEGKAVCLKDGRRELPAAPGSAMKTRTAVWRQPVFGDLDGDGDQDAILVLVHDPGGSGTFYYVAAAINVNGRYLGTQAILMGDRIVPLDIGIRNGMAEVSYTDRPPEAPMSTNPSIDKTAVLSLKYDQLFKAALLEEKATIFKGWVTIGHEVRTFKPCDKKEVLWLMGQSPAIKAITDAYRRVLPDGKAYQPLFVVLAGELVDPPDDGFGADYENAFLATRLVRVARGESGDHDNLVNDPHAPIIGKITFDLSKLDEQGLYGSPGGKRALSYEFCIPDTAENRTEVKGIDPSVTFFAESPGRIGCGKIEILCIASTHRKNFTKILQQLSDLPYVQRIDQSFFD